MKTLTWNMLLTVSVFGALLALPVSAQQSPKPTKAEPDSATVAKWMQQMEDAMQPAKGPIPSEYDLTPAPVAVNETALTAQLARDKNSLFSLTQFRDEMKVEFDDFLVPNGGYAVIDCNWTKLFSTKGADVLRAPTATEQKKDDLARHFHRLVPLHVSDKQSKVAYAEGTATLTIPSQFVSAAFAATEVKTGKTAGKYTITLQRCDNNLVVVQIMGLGKDEEPVFVLRDRTGGRLQVTESNDNNLAGLKKTMLAKGIVARVEVYLATAVVNTTLPVIASCEPDTMGTDRIPMKAPRYAKPELDLKAAAIDLLALKAQTRVIAGRTDALFGYNTPDIKLQLPHLANSCYAGIKFGPATLVSKTGKPVKYELEQVGFTCDDCSYAIRFTNPGTEVPVEFARATGKITVKYPADVKVVTLTPAQPAAGNIKVNFNGMKISLCGIDEKLDANAFLPTNLAAIRAFDDSGRQLQQLNYSGSRTADDVTWNEMAFWGQPTVVRVVVIDKWLPMDLPYDLPPLPKLVAPKMGG